MVNIKDPNSNLKKGDLVQYRLQYLGKSLAIKSFDEFATLFEIQREEPKYYETSSGGWWDAFQYQSTAFKLVAELIPSSPKFFNFNKFAKHDFASFQTKNFDAGIWRLLDQSTVNLDSKYVDVEDYKSIKKPTMIIQEKRVWPISNIVDPITTIYKCMLFSDNMQMQTVFVLDGWIEPLKKASYHTELMGGVRSLIEAYKAKHLNRK